MDNNDSEGSCDNNDDDRQRKPRRPAPFADIDSYIYEDCHAPQLSPQDAAAMPDASQKKTRAALLARLPRYAVPAHYGQLLRKLGLYSLDEYFENTEVMNASIRSTCMQPTLQDAGLHDVFLTLEPRSNPAWRDLMTRLTCACALNHAESERDEATVESCRLVFLRLLRSLKWYFCHIQQPVLPPRKLDSLNADLGCEEDWIAFVCDLCLVWQHVMSLSAHMRDIGPRLKEHRTLHSLSSIFVDILWKHVYPLTCAILTEWLEKRRDDIIGIGSDGMWNIALRRLVLILAALVTRAWNHELVYMDPPHETHPMHGIWQWMQTQERNLDIEQWGKLYDEHITAPNKTAKEWLVIWASGLPLIPPQHHLDHLRGKPWHAQRYAAFCHGRASTATVDSASELHHDRSSAQPRSSRFWNLGLSTKVPLRQKLGDMGLMGAWNLTRSLQQTVAAGCHFPILQWLFGWVLWSCKWSEFLLDPTREFTDSLHGNSVGGPARIDYSRLTECLILFEPVSRASISEATRRGDPKAAYILRDDVLVEIESYMVHMLHATMVASRLEFLARDAWEADADPVQLTDCQSHLACFRPTETEGLEFAHQIIGFLSKEARDSRARNILVERYKRMSYGYLLHPSMMAIHAWATCKMPVATRRYLDLLQFARPSDVNAITTCIYEDSAAIHMFLAACTRDPLSVFARMRPDDQHDLIASSFAKPNDVFALRSPALTMPTTRETGTGHRDNSRDATAAVSLMLTNMPPMPLVSQEIRREVHARLGLLWYQQALESWLDRKSITSILQRIAMGSLAQAATRLSDALLDAGTDAEGAYEDTSALREANIVGGATTVDKQRIQRSDAARRSVVSELTRLAENAIQTDATSAERTTEEICQELSTTMRRKFIDARGPRLPSAGESNIDAPAKETPPRPFLQNVYIANYSVRSLGSLDELRNREATRAELRGALPPVGLWRVLYDSDVLGRFAPLYKFDHVTGSVQCDMNTSQPTPVIIGLGHEYWVWSKPAHVFVRTREWLLALKAHAILCQQQFGATALRQLTSVPTQSPVDPISARVFLKYTDIDITSD